jgi:hypothetical protein
MTTDRAGLSALIAALRDQTQIDEDGVMCGVSRQAVDEAISILEAGAAASVPREPTQWLWRVWNLGWPDGHEDSSNEWGDWSIISDAEHRRLAKDDPTKRYQFVRYVPTTPNTAPAVAQLAAQYQSGEVASATRKDVGNAESAMVQTAELTASTSPDPLTPTGINDLLRRSDEASREWPRGVMQELVRDQAAAIRALREEYVAIKKDRGIAVGGWEQAREIADKYRHGADDAWVNTRRAEAERDAALAALRERMAQVYAVGDSETKSIIAELCDQDWDKSGALLGHIRAAARAVVEGGKL